MSNNKESNSFLIPDNSTTEFVKDAFTGNTALNVSSTYGPGTSFKVGNSAQNHSGYKASVWVKGSKDAYLHIQANEEWDISKRVTNTEEGERWHLLEVELPRVMIEPRFSSSLYIKVYVGTTGSPAIFDDLRFCPMDAQMTSYTYDPLIGMTSVSDVNNKPTTYEYNGFNRLYLTRDYLGNILKKYEYNYRVKPNSNL